MPSADLDQFTPEDMQWIINMHLIVKPMTPDQRIVWFREHRDQIAAIACKYSPIAFAQAGKVMNWLGLV